MNSSLRGIIACGAHTHTHTRKHSVGDGIYIIKLFHTIFAKTKTKKTRLKTDSIVPHGRENSIQWVAAHFSRLQFPIEYFQQHNPAPLGLGKAKKQKKKMKQKRGGENHRLAEQGECRRKKETAPGYSH